MVLCNTMNIDILKLTFVWQINFKNIYIYYIYILGQFCTSHLIFIKLVKMDILVELDTLVELDILKFG